MSDQTPLDVEAIRARLDAATPGPWVYEPSEALHGIPDAHLHYVSDPVAIADDDPPLCSFHSRADAEMVAAAPTDLRRLLDENARLRTQLANLRSYAAVVDVSDEQAAARAVAALSERLSAKNAELDRVIRAQAPSAFDGAPPVRINEDGSQSYGPYAAPEMPRPPAVESPTHFAPYGHAATSCGETIPKRMPWNFAAADWDSPAITTRRAMATCVLCLAVFRNASESANGAAQTGAGGPYTPGTGSGMGTGVAEAEDSAQASAPWIPSFYGSECPHRTEWTCPEHGECRACECDCNTYVADLEEPDLTLIPGDMVVRDPEVCSGRPTMRGTRILASRIAGELAAGTSWETLREWYPSLPSLPVPSTEEADR